MVQHLQLKNAGYEVETKVNTPVTDANYDFGTTVPAHPEYIVSKEELKDKLANDKNFRLVSIRSLDEFKGLSDGNYPMLQEKVRLPEQYSDVQGMMRTQWKNI